MKSAYFSKKVFICSFCGKERTGNFSPEAKRITCWNCIDKLGRMTKNTLDTLYKRLDNNKDDRKVIIENFMEDMKNEAGRAVAGERSRGKVRYEPRKNRQVPDSYKMDRRGA